MKMKIGCHSLLCATLFSVISLYFPFCLSCPLQIQISEAANRQHPRPSSVSRPALPASYQAQSWRREARERRQAAEETSDTLPSSQPDQRRGLHRHRVQHGSEVGHERPGWGEIPQHSLCRCVCHPKSSPAPQRGCQRRAVRTGKLPTTPTT